jgi:hypothetical protein
MLLSPLPLPTTVTIVLATLKLQDISDFLQVVAIFAQLWDFLVDRLTGVKTIEGSLGSEKKMIGSFKLSFYNSLFYCYKPKILNIFRIIQ